MVSSDAGETEDTVEQRSPDADVDVIAQLKADAAEDKEPEDDHEREVEATEGRGVEERESEVERASPGKEPDFIAVPHGADGVQAGATLGLSAHEKEVKHADAEVEAVEHHVSYDHYRNQPEPYKAHHDDISSIIQLLEQQPIGCVLFLAP